VFTGAQLARTGAGRSRSRARRRLPVTAWPQTALLVAHRAADDLACVDALPLRDLSNRQAASATPTLAASTVVIAEVVRDLCRDHGPCPASARPRLSPNRPNRGTSSEGPSAVASSPRAAAPRMGTKAPPRLNRSLAPKRRGRPGVGGRPRGVARAAAHPSTRPGSVRRSVGGRTGPLRNGRSSVVWSRRPAPTETGEGRWHSPSSLRTPTGRRPIHRRSDQLSRTGRWATRSH
jgi:hypothetical protein